ncbi:sodium stibogluconate resistance protein [Novymonas esmeraldas]|uniref:Sodium stibogluconate resistance protein n=1 Tax=Novymonas esmeraldas TaxID=1808958 RepID=A0AAW0F815_9TRYP
MGNSQSTVPKEAQGHPALFYRGVKAANEGRYTVSELYFVQALSRHPGQHFWDTFTKAVLQKENKLGAEKGNTSPSKGDLDKEKADVDPDVGGPLDPSNDAPGRQSLFAAPSTEKGNGDSNHAGGKTNGSEELSDGRDSDDDESSARQTDAKTNGAQSLYSTKVADIQLPLNGNLFPVMDYFRMMADIANAYLVLLATTPCPEKVMGIAARYCLFTISQTQMLLHCLTLWKEDKFGDGGGFIDYEKKRGLKFGVDVADRNSTELDTDTSSGNSGASKQKWRTMDRTASLLFTLALLEAKCRYYFLSSVVCYCGLLFRASATVKEGRKQNRVFANAQEHLEVAVAMVWDLAKEYPNEYLSKLIMTTLPRSSSGDRDMHSSIGASSHASNQMSMSLGNDQHRHLYASGSPWTPTQSALIPLISARNVRLSIQQDVGSHSQAQLRSPAERMSNHYVVWGFPVEVFVVPGCSLYLLERSLPGFVPGKSTLEHQVTISEQDTLSGSSQGRRSNATQDGNVAVPLPGNGDGAAAAQRNSVASENEAEKKKREEAMKKCEKALAKKRRYINSDLNLSDERTCVALCLEEVCVLTLPVIYLSAALSSTAGEPENAESYLETLRSLTLGLYGPTSSEWHLIRTLVQKRFPDFA